MISLQCFILLVIFCSASAMSCTQCLGIYDSAKKKPGYKTDAEICNDLKLFIGCLYIPPKGCVGTKEIADIVVKDSQKFSCAGEFKGVCGCQYHYYKVSPGKKLEGVCEMAQHQLWCSKSETEPSCDGIIKNGEEHYARRLDFIDHAKCPVDDTCKCEITMNKLQNNCQTYLNTLSCLATSTTGSCDHRRAKRQVAGDVNEKLEASCPKPSEACQCEIDAAVSLATSYTTACSTLHTLYDCLNDVYNENITKVVCGGEDSDVRAKKVRIVGGLNLCLFSLSSAVCINTYIPLLVMSLIVVLKLSA